VSLQCLTKVPPIRINAIHNLRPLRTQLHANCHKLSIRSIKPGQLRILWKFAEFFSLRIILHICCGTHLGICLILMQPFEKCVANAGLTAVRHPGICIFLKHESQLIKTNSASVPDSHECVNGRQNTFVGCVSGAPALPG
jgi:hypothetical protein